MTSEHDPNGAGASRDRDDAAQMFELAPVSLWLEDYRRLKTLFNTWRAEGVTDLRTYLNGDAARVAECSRCIQIVQVNKRTLQLYEANDRAHLEQNLNQVFRDDMLDAHIEELAQLWDGQCEFFSNTVNYTLTGKRLDIQLKGTVLPGYENDWQRVLVAVEDVTERATARRELARAELYARGLFEHSPVSLWVEDFSAIKRLLDEVRSMGITDFRVFTDVHPEFVERCIAEIRVIDVNRCTLELFGAPDKNTLLRRLSEVFRDDMLTHFNHQLIDLWEGKLFHRREVVNYSLEGHALNIYLQFSVLPGHEHDWSLVQVALTDISARKKAEAYLEFLGKHDPLTKLHNRAFYIDELNRLERKGPFPVTVIIADLNGLKPINDQLGHAAGDDLLRRAGEVFTEGVRRPFHVARIGGDEFAILMPATDERAGTALVEQIDKLVEINNQFYSGVPLSLSMGVSTSRPNERLEVAIARADARMYKAKQAYYEGITIFDRRTKTDPADER